MRRRDSVGMADNFETNLTDLDNAARGHLPALANVYWIATTQAKGTSTADQDLGADPSLCHNAGSFGKAWVTARDQIADALNTCQANFTTIGTALAHVVDTYAATETQLAGKMKAVSDSIKPVA
ncbi:MAG TPA: hypothetical protein VGM75_37830 [Pseudonocardiaceae bacterium]|jgi:hypothetical protein